ncbi:MAG: DUF2892 domain-containing protein [Bacteroidota bacterium]
MKRNMGNMDRMIRILIALAVTVLYFMNIIPGTLGLILMAVAGIFVLTSTVNFCPIYAGLGLSTFFQKKNRA